MLRVTTDVPLAVDRTILMEMIIITNVVRFPVVVTIGVVDEERKAVAVEIAAVGGDLRHGLRAGGAVIPTISSSITKREEHHPCDDGKVVVREPVVEAVRADNTTVVLATILPTTRRRGGIAIVIKVTKPLLRQIIDAGLLPLWRPTHH